MPNVTDYVRNYGSTSFKEKPFCDEDNVALCMSFYMPLDKAVSPSFDEEPVPFSDACKKLYALRGNKHKPVGLVLVKGISVLLMAMAEQKRYSEMRVVACTDNFDKSPAVQFNAATYLLPDGKIVVLFRGTDDTLIGWQEDVNILTEGGVPSDKLSLDYLAEVAKRFDGDIIVCGHSKGGYVAQYAVMNSPKEIRDRVVALYNNDGPGMPTYDYLGGEIYKELLPKYKHLIPKSSFIGMMLSHDDDYTIVDSKRITGGMQHDMLTWKFNGDKLITLPELTKSGKLADLVFNDMVANLTDNQRVAFATAVDRVFDGMGQRGLLDVKSNIGSSIKGGKKAWKALDDETKKELKGIAKNAKGYIKQARKTIKKGEYKKVSERIEKK